VSPWRDTAGWGSDVPDRLVEVAERVCTDRQLEALRLASHGYGYRRSGKILGISASAVSDRLQNAYLNIQRAYDLEDETIEKLREIAGQRTQ